MRDLPQLGIQLPPYFVGRVVPRPMHIQGKLRQGIEPLIPWEEVVDWVADSGWFAHDFTFEVVPDESQLEYSVRYSQPLQPARRKPLAM